MGYFLILGQKYLNETHDHEDSRHKETFEVSNMKRKDVEDTLSESIGAQRH